MHSSDEMYAAVFGRGVSRVYAGWKMRFCTFSTIVNSTAARLAEASRRGLAERSSAVWDVPATDDTEPTRAWTPLESEAERRQLIDDDAFTIAISGQVDPISEPLVGECLFGRDFAVRAKLRIELLTNLEARNPFTMASLQRSLIAGLQEASGLSTDQVLDFDIDGLTETAGSRSAAVQFTFRAPEEYSENVKTLVLKLLNNTDAVFASTSIYHKRPLALIYILSGPSIMMPSALAPDFITDHLFTELSFPLVDFRNLTLDGIDQFPNHVQVGRVAPELWNYSPEQLSPYGAQFRNTLLEGFARLTERDDTKVAILGFEPLQPYENGQWWPSGVRVMAAVDFSVTDTSELVETPIRLARLMHGARLEDLLLPGNDALYGRICHDSDMYAPLKRMVVGLPVLELVDMRVRVSIP
jgi:hypothetical protein